MDALAIRSDGSPHLDPTSSDEQGQVLKMTEQSDFQELHHGALWLGELSRPPRCTVSTVISESNSAVQCSYLPLPSNSAYSRVQRRPRLFYKGNVVRIAEQLSKGTPTWQKAFSIMQRGGRPRHHTNTRWPGGKQRRAPEINRDV